MEEHALAWTVAHYVVAWARRAVADLDDGHLVVWRRGDEVNVCAEAPGRVHAARWFESGEPQTWALRVPAELARVGGSKLRRPDDGLLWVRGEPAEPAVPGPWDSLRPRWERPLRTLFVRRTHLSRALREVEAVYKAREVPRERWFVVLNGWRARRTLSVLDAHTLRTVDVLPLERDAVGESEFDAGVRVRLPWLQRALAAFGSITIGLSVCESEGRLRVVTQGETSVTSYDCSVRGVVDVDDVVKRR